MKTTSAKLALTIVATFVLQPAPAQSTTLPLRQLAYATEISTVTLSRAPLRETVTIADVAASVSLRQTAREEVQVIVDFESPTYPVACLSPYRDLHFVLRDSQGRLVKINTQTLHQPPAEGYGTFNHVRSANAGKPYNCSNDKTKKQTTWVRLSQLYPNLSPGTYSLTITFAPQAITQQRSFAPFTIVVS
jgi:hypothetical protein